MNQSMRAGMVFLCLASATPASATCVHIITGGDATCRDADDEFGGGTVRAGQDGGSGSVQVAAGQAAVLGRSSVDNPPSGGPGPFMAIGRSGVGASGSASVNGAGTSLTLEADNTSASVQIGRDGAIGTVTVSNGGALRLLDSSATPGSGATQGESLFVGRDGGTGTLSASTGSSVTVDSNSGAFMFVGRNGGTGTATFSAGSTLTLHDREAVPGGVGSNIAVGRGGTGLLSLQNSSASITSDSAFAGLFIGRDAGGNGTVNMGASGFSISGDTASVVVGASSATTGTLTLGSGATLSMNSNRSLMDVGRAVGSSGSVTVSGGASVSVGGPAGNNSDLLVGAAFADIGGRAAAGTGSFIISGAGSSVTVTDVVVVGAPLSFGGGSASGTLTVADGATLTVGNTLYLGAGGVLNGNGGTIIGSVLVDGGILAPGASPGTLTIVGDLEVQDGLIEIEIGGTGAGQFDLINVTGDLLVPDELLIRVNFVDSFVPEVDDLFSFLDIGGAVRDQAGNELTPESFFLNANIDVQGAPVGTTFELAVVSGGVQTSTVAVAQEAPAPGSAVLLTGGLVLMAAGLARKKAHSAANRPTAGHGGDRRPGESMGAAITS